MKYISKIVLTLIIFGCIATLIVANELSQECLFPEEEILTIDGLDYVLSLAE